MPRYRFGPKGSSHRGEARQATPGQDQYQTTLERDYRHVLAAIQTMWGYPELNAYFLKLTMSDRNQRAGFPPDVWEDIHLLWTLHQSLVPDTSPQRRP